MTPEEGGDASRLRLDARVEIGVLIPFDGFVEPSGKS